ncbi:MAG: DUF6580 family putative transport protein [Candidatus Pelagibacterales bacterium]|tara:strand:- start:7806 stop:8207 length:402 start_codon:yes stop_codon:yes gene_type:complete
MNVTPLFAIAILLPSLTSNRYIQYLLPMTFLLIKDIFIGFHSLMIPVYGCMCLFVLASKFIKNEIYATFVGVITWHVLINYAVWYKSGGDLVTTYIMAIPFDFNLLVSTLICVIIGKLCIKYYYQYFFSLPLR